MNIKKSTIGHARLEKIHNPLYLKIKFCDGLTAILIGDRKMICEKLGIEERGILFDKAIPIVARHKFSVIKDSEFINHTQFESYLNRMNDSSNNVILL